MMNKGCMDLWKQQGLCEGHEAEHVCGTRSLAAITGVVLACSSADTGAVTLNNSSADLLQIATKQLQM